MACSGNKKLFIKHSYATLNSKYAFPNKETAYVYVNPHEAVCDIQTKNVGIREVQHKYTKVHKSTAQVQHKYTRVQHKYSTSTQEYTKVFGQFPSRTKKKTTTVSLN